MNQAVKARPARRANFTWITVAAFWLLALAIASAASTARESAGATDAGGVATSGHSSMNWPGFRGVGGVGHAIDANPPISWSGKEGKNILWKTEVAKHGLSSPVVAGNRVFLTAADEAARQLLCYDADTGKLLWQHNVDGIPGLTNPVLPNVLEETGFAASTSATDGYHVAAVFATGELICVNTIGKRVWARHLGIPKNHYGHASSLAAHENLLIVQLDQRDDSRLLAFDMASGNLAWQVKRSTISWSSPILVNNKGRKELILTNSKAVDGYDPQTGQHLWQVECLAGEVASSAAYADGVVFVANEGAKAVAIDISRHDANPKILWHWEGALPDSSSPLANGDYLIIPTGFGVVTCLDTKTGKVFWEHEFDNGFSSSPILVNDRVYLTDLSGNTHIFKLGKEFRLVGEADIGEDVYATPAFVGDRIYIRSLTQLFCIADRKSNSE